MKTLKNIGKKLYGIFADVCLDNTDGCARARSAMLYTGYLNVVINALTAGTFFSALLLAMGAEDTFIGYVSMATSFCAVVQYLSPLFWERLQRRKVLIVVSGAICNFITYVGITCIPFLPVATGTKLWLYFGASLLNALLSNFRAPAATAWTVQSLPLAKRVNYSTLTVMPNNVINALTAFLASRFLDGMMEKGYAWGSITPELTAILMLRIGAGILIIVSQTATAVCIKEHPYEPSGNRVGLRMMLIPLKNVPFLLSIIIPCMYTFTSNVIGSYFNIHLINNVEMPYTVISLAGVISIPMVVLFTPIWSVIAKKYNWFTTFAVSFVGYNMAWLCNVFITGETTFFYFLAIVVGNMFCPGISLVVGNMVYLKMPKSQRTVYLSFYAIIYALFQFAGQTIGTLFVKCTGNWYFTLFGISVCNLQLISALAVCFGIPVSVYAAFFARRAIAAAEKKYGASDTETL